MHERILQQCAGGRCAREIRHGDRRASYVFQCDTIAAGRSLDHLSDFSFYAAFCAASGTDSGVWRDEQVEDTAWVSGDSCVDHTGYTVDAAAHYHFLWSGLWLSHNIWSGSEAGRITATVVAFSINYACYFSVIFRGGIEGVPVGQREAGEVLGMTKSQIFFRVTLLQMVKRVVPPMSNEIITLVKDTSLARIIAAYELTFAGYSFMKSSGITWPLFYTGVFYLLFVGILTLLFRYIEQKLSYFR